MYCKGDDRMDNAELGRRLKAARLAKKMTQSDVVGTFITRNMLSQIESGSATPSMKTLEYLAGVLEIPMDKLLAEGNLPEETENGIFTLVHAKQLLTEKRYEDLLRSCIPEGAIADELHALRSIAHLGIAQRLSESEETESLQSAVMHARSAVKEAETGIYANSARVAQANQLIARIAQYLSSYYSNLADTAI
jgi:transcriptional regulator with XRE-family HTH domain